jgi:hypothetical protein
MIGFRRSGPTACPVAEAAFERNNHHLKNPERVQELWKRIDGLAGKWRKSLSLEEVFKGIAKGRPESLRRYLTKMDFMSTATNP